MRRFLFFFSESNIGGTETTFIEIIKEFSKNNIKCYVIVTNNKGPLLDILNNYIIDSCIINIKSFNIIKTLFLFNKFIKKNKIELIFNFGLKIEIFSRLFSKLFGVQYIISNIRSIDSWRRWYHILLDKICRYNTDLWVSNSKAAKIIFSERDSININKIHVIYNISEIIDTSITKSDNTKDIITYKVGVLTNLKKGKGIEDIIHYCRFSNTNYQFYIAGKDYSNNYYQKQVDKYNLQNKIKFLGFITKKSEFFDNIDVFLLPSYWEGMPCSILESLKFGVPVISTNVGGIPEIIIDNFNGFLFNPGDLITLEKKLNCLLENKMLQNKFVENGLNIYQNNFDNKININKWFNLINTLYENSNNNRC